MPGLGHKSYLQIGTESTYGTAVAATGLKLEVIQANIDPVVGVIQDPSLYSAQSRRALYQGGLFYRGRIVVRGNYEGMGRLLKSAFGSVATTGAGPYTHTFKEAASPTSLTLELIEGDIPASQCKRVIGALVTDMAVRVTAGQGLDAMLQAEFGIIAKTVTTGFTPTAALSFPSIKPVLFHQSNATTNDGSGDTQANQRTRSIELTLANAYAEDRFYLGSVNPDQPVRNDFLTARWRITSEFNTKTALDRAIAFTSTAPTMKFVSGADTIEFRSNSAKIVEYGNPIEAYGIILMNITHEAFYDATDLSALVCVMVNTLASGSELP